MISHLKQKIIRENLSNIEILERDFVKDGTVPQENSVDYVRLFFERYESKEILPAPTINRKINPKSIEKSVLAS